MRYTTIIALGCALSLAGCGPLLTTPAASPTFSASPTTAPTAQPLATETPSAAPTVAPTAVPTQGHLTHVDWRAYHDDIGGFTIQYPPTWKKSDNSGVPVEFVLTAAEGTTLLETLMDIDVTPNATQCSEQRYDGQTNPSENVTVNGVDFLKETGAGLGAGNVYEWTGYSALKGTTCITITFVLHSANPGVYATPPPDFDEAAASEIFAEMLDTFHFDP